MESNKEELAKSTQLDELPPIVVMHLDKDQKEYLQFERRKFKVIGTPKVQTIHIGSVGKGHSTGGGLGTALSDSWGIFGNLSSIKMATMNQFRTDIQLRLENEETHEKIFFEKSFPVEMTLSIEPGDSFSIFHVRAEEKNLLPENRKFTHWTPFIAQNDETKQLLPLGSVPPVIIPEPEYNYEPTAFGLWMKRHSIVVTIVVIAMAIGFILFMGYVANLGNAEPASTPLPVNIGGNTSTSQ